MLQANEQTCFPVSGLDQVRSDVVRCHRRSGRYQGSLALCILACESIRFSSGYLYPDKPESRNNKRERDERKKKLASSAIVQIG